MGNFRSSLPLGTTDVKVLLGNASNFDEAMHEKILHYWLDRFGRQRLTWHGIEEQFHEFLVNSGYQDMGEYVAGLELTARNQMFHKDGELYRSSAALVLPYKLTGDWDQEKNLFAAMGDQALRQQLSDTLDLDLGAGLIPTVSRNVRSVALVRRLPKTSNPWAHAMGYYTPGDGGSGLYYLDPNDIESEDNGGTIIVANDGGRWKLNHNGTVSVSQFGAVGDEKTDDTKAIQSAFSQSALSEITLPSGKVFRVTQHVDAHAFVNLNGATLFFDVEGRTRCLEMKSGGVLIGGKIKVNGKTPITSGNFQCPITVGDYASGIGVNNVALWNVTVESDVKNGNQILITGDSKNIQLNNITLVAHENVGRGILIHWGGSDEYEKLTTHPSGIQINNLTVSGSYGDDAGVLFISAAHDIRVDGVYCDGICGTGITIFAGDYGYKYAGTYGERENAFKNIEIKNARFKQVKKELARVDLLAPKVTDTVLTYIGKIDLENVRGVSSGSTQNGVLVANAGGVRVDGVLVDGFQNGFNAATRASDTVFTDCESRGAVGNGFVIGSSENFPERVSVIDCKSYGSGSYAFLCGKSRDAVLRGCRSGYAGIQNQMGFMVTEEAIGVTLDGNHVQRSKQGVPAFTLAAYNSYGAIKLFRNNTCADGIQLTGGLSTIPTAIKGQGADLVRELYGEIPQSGAWKKGDVVWLKPNLIGPDAVGAVCTTAGSPGVWSQFG